MYCRFLCSMLYYLFFSVLLFIFFCVAVTLCEIKIYIYNVLIYIMIYILYI